MVSKLNDIFNIKHQLVFSLNQDNLRNVIPSVDVTFIEITNDNINDVLDFRDNNHLENFHQFLKEGQLGIYAWIGSRAVGHGWAKLCNEENCRVNGYMDIFHGDALIHYCNVKSEYRGKNIYPSILFALCKTLFSNADTKQVLIDAEVNNIASCRGISKVGFKLRERCTFVQCKGHLICKLDKSKWV